MYKSVHYKLADTVMDCNAHQSLYTVLLIGSAKDALAWARIPPCTAPCGCISSGPPHACIILASIHASSNVPAQQDTPLSMYKGRIQTAAWPGLRMYVRAYVYNQSNERHLHSAASRDVRNRRQMHSWT